MGINISVSLSFLLSRTFPMPPPPLSLSLPLSSTPSTHSFQQEIRKKKCGLLQQPIYPLLGRAYHQSPLQLLYITSSESQSRRIARRVDGCDGWWMMVGQRGRSVTLSDWNHLNDGDSKTAGSGFRCRRPSIRRQQNREQSRWLTGYFTSHESIRIESLVEGAFACSHIHHTRVERNDCRRGCVGGSHTLMDGLIGHRVSG